METIARVFDIEITDADLYRESKALEKTALEEGECFRHVLNRLIDRCLLFHEARVCGITVEDEEFDTALLEKLSEMDSEGYDYPKTAEDAEELEKLIRRQILIRKHIKNMCMDSRDIDDSELLSFYEDQKDVFRTPELVRASHILIRIGTPEAETKARQIRASIRGSEDFIHSICKDSECPSNQQCGDLGFFPRGRMIKEIEDVAFSLQVGQVSDVFASPYGYHILLLTDKMEPSSLPYEEIKDSLKSRLIQLEREFFLVRYVQQLREQNKEHIVILKESLHLA
jgi:parvulin-like peptidyl-prolyl isomerase